MNREYFLKTGTFAALAVLSNRLFAKALPVDSNHQLLFKDDLLKRLLIANDKQVAGLLTSIRLNDVRFSRKIGYDFSVLAASWCSPDSQYYHNPMLVSRLEILTKVLERYQTADGTVNIGNLESPPDTAFLTELLTTGAHLLIKDNSKELNDVNAEIKKFLLSTGDALTTGGIHTPNHRWVISAALAKLNALYPDKKFVGRIEDWLSEGVYNDSDGHYPERSVIYSGVENTAFITIGRLLDKPELFVPVRKNLEMMYYYMEPNGEMVTTDSRRQDQYMIKEVFPFYLHYRYMAIKDNNRQFAAIAKFIEGLYGFENEILNTSYFHFLEEPLLQQELPATVPLNDNYEKLFKPSHLVRIRRGSTTATLFGGVDWPIIIASGRSNSPNFFSYRKGKAILKYARLSSGFFSMGYFYSAGLQKEGGSYLLYKKLEVPYYQPLPKNLQNSEGDYKLSPSIDDRFWNKMDFEKRPLSNVKTLETAVSLAEKNGACELTFRVTGLVGVPVTIELCFDESGRLSGTEPAENENSFLEKGFGKYENGGDTIQFGPGSVVNKTVTGLEGERYSTHFGSLRTEGKHVFLTGISPFNHKLIFS